MVVWDRELPARSSRKRRSGVPGHGPLGWALGFAVLSSACASSGTDGQQAPSFAKGSGASGTAAGARTDFEDPLVEVLLDEGHYVFDADGRLTRTLRREYRVLRQAALSSGWAVVRASWSPWFEQRPTIAATVTSPDGRVVELDPASIETSGLAGDSSVMFRDDGTLRAPLPNLEVGSVVKLRVTLADHEPFFEGGKLGHFFFGMGVPVKRARLVVEAPESAPLAAQRVGEVPEPREEVVDGRRRLTFEAEDLAPEGSLPASSPPELLAGAHVKVGVGRSWGAIAARYAQIVEARIEQSDVDALGFEVPAAGSFSPSARADVIAALAQQVHARIRYTGLELGSASIIPAPPHVVVERSFGDCKDKSTLLVALLRRAGIDAHVALVRSGYEPPVAESLPSGYDFNHAVVFVPGEPAFWVDATIEGQPVDYVPTNLQGRRALIANAETTGLTAIPELPAQTNLYREQRVVRMAEYGFGRVDETTEGRGMFAIWQRSNWKDPSRSSLNEGLTRYAQEHYGAASVEDISVSTPTRPTAPVALTFTAVDAAVVQTLDADAEAQLSKRALFADLPSGILAEEGEGPREVDLYFPEPYSAEIEYEVVMPVGFAVRAPLEDERWALGPATLSRTFREAEDRAFFTYRFDSGPRRWSPAEVEAFRAATADIPTDEVLSLVHIGARSLARGQVGEALDVYRGLAEAHPDSAVQWARLADGLNEAGLAIPARTAAVRAAQIDPDAYVAQFYVAYTHANDELGRPYQQGFDRARTIDAYRKAKALDPDAYAARYNLALTLEVGADGEPWGPGADLEAAVEEYRAIERDFEGATVANDIRLALLRAGRFEELEETARADPEDAARGGHLIAAVAINRGLDAALDEADTLGREIDREQVFAEARDLLIAAREYGLASELVRRVSSALDADARQSAELLAKMRPWPEVFASLSPELRVARRFMIMGVDAGASVDRWEAALTQLLAESPAIRDEDLRTTAENSARAFREAVGSLEEVKEVRSLYGPHYYSDFTAATITGRVQGRAGDASRIEVAHADGGESKTYVYTRSRGRDAQLVAVQGMWPQLAHFAWRALDDGDLDAAASWLDWILDEMRDPDAQPKIPWFRSTWPGPTGDRQLRTVERARLAAAILMANHPALASDAIPVLEAARRSAPQASAFDAEQAVIRAYRSAGRAREVVDRAAALAEGRGLGYQRWYARVLEEAGRPQEAVQALRPLLEQAPNDVPSGLNLSRLLAANQDYEGALKIIQSLLATGSTNPSLLNQYAWLGLFLPSPPDDLVDMARAAAELQGNRQIATLHTLGCTYAATGQTKAATDVLQHLNTLITDPMPDLFLIQGLIAEHHGLKEGAIAAYEATRRTRDRGPTSSWALAQLRLRRLK